MKITKDQLQQIIREEYVKVILESKGYSPTQRQVRMLAENLDEGLFDSLGKAVKGAISGGKEAFKKSREEEKEKLSKQQEAKNDAAESKTQMQIKERLMSLQQKAKDMLKDNGYVGEDNDVAVLGIDLFRAAIQEVMEVAKIKGKIKPMGDRGVGVGRFSPATSSARRSA